MKDPLRRRILAVAALGAIATQFARAREKLFRIVLIANTIPLRDLRERIPSHPGPALIENGLKALGWRDGENIELVWRSAESDYSRFPAIVAEVVALKPDVIVGFGRSALWAAEATSSIPIVMATGSAPIRYGVAKSLARPGGNVTGMTQDAGTELNGKRLSLMKQASPTLRRVAFVGSPNEFDETPGFSPETQAAARSLQLVLVYLPSRGLSSFPELFSEAARQRIDGLVFPDMPDLHWAKHQQGIHALAIKHRMVILHTVLSAAETGGLMAFGSDVLDNYRRAPYFIDRILRGAKPADLPFEQPGKFELIINLNAARAIGLTIPPLLIAQASRVIE